VGNKSVVSSSPRCQGRAMTMSDSSHWAPWVRLDWDFGNQRMEYWVRGSSGLSLPRIWLILCLFRWGADSQWHQIFHKRLWIPIYSWSQECYS
jgi:hypothetical protein